LDEQPAANRKALGEASNSFDTALSNALAGPDCNCSSEDNNKKETKESSSKEENPNAVEKSAGGGGRANGSDARLTRPQQRQAAKYLGMKEVKSLKSHDELVFQKGGRYFSFSNTSHIPGEVFKEVDRNGNRMFTTDLNLNRIGK
jgi:Novel toxin 21